MNDFGDTVDMSIKVQIDGILMKINDDCDSSDLLTTNTIKGEKKDAFFVMSLTTCQQLTVIRCYDKLLEMDYAIMSQASKRYEEEASTNIKIFSIMRKAERNLKKVNVKC